MRYFITGAAGFIGSHLITQLSGQDNEILGVDSLDPYYDISLKQYRIDRIQRTFKGKLSFLPLDLGDSTVLENLENFKPEVVIHLAAQPGVRLGINGRAKYIAQNISAFLDLASMIQRVEPEVFLYASSSSVYGKSAPTPFRETNKDLHPSSIYGITKLANELFAESIFSEGKIRSRGLRFFSVYGPSGRPDMAYFQALACVRCGEKFPRFGDGDVLRDYTYIDDVCESIKLLVAELLQRPKGFSDVVNIGGGNPISLNQLISKVGELTHSKVEIEERGSFREDLKATHADFSYLASLTKKSSFVSIDDGLERTVGWFNSVATSDIRRWSDVGLMRTLIEKSETSAH